jgi:hypothetical protein
MTSRKHKQCQTTRLNGLHILCKKWRGAVAVFQEIDKKIYVTASGQHREERHCEKQTLQRTTLCHHVQL